MPHASRPSLLTKLQALQGFRYFTTYGCCSSLHRWCTPARHMGVAIGHEDEVATNHGAELSSKVSDWSYTNPHSILNVIHYTEAPRRIAFNNFSLGATLSHLLSIQELAPNPMKVMKINIK
eukprot:2288199-Amphidinium_carterae.1